MAQPFWFQVVASKSTPMHAKGQIAKSLLSQYLASKPGLPNFQKKRENVAFCSILTLAGRGSSVQARRVAATVAPEDRGAWDVGQDDSDFRHRWLCLRTGSGITEARPCPRAFPRQELLG